MRNGHSFIFGAMVYLMAVGAAVGSTVVEFPDPALEEVIRETIHKPTSDILDTDLLGVQQLNGDNKGIIDLTGLGFCVNLKALYLDDNQISDMSAVVGLTNLTTLDLARNQISDLDTLIDNAGIGSETYRETDAAVGPHSADVDGDWNISLSELLRVTQFYNSGGYHCDAMGEDGYTAGPGDTACIPHNSDYTPQNWRFNLSEVLRAIQLYNSNGYHTQCHSEDTFAPGPGPHETCGGEQYTLTYSAAANGSISGISPQTVVYGGSGSTVTAIPDPHYHFVQWSDGMTDNPRTDVYVRTNITVTAMFAAGVTVYVAQGSTGDGSSWASPLGSIQEAVDYAVSSDEVWVAAGTYTAMTDPVIRMKEGVALYGGFACTEAGRDERDWDANVTIIDGENARRCVLGANNATLDGFTITHGRVVGSNGAGMLNEGVSPSVTNCIFIANVCRMDDHNGGNGGGMCNSGSYFLSVTNCTFMGNSAHYGGGMYNDDSSPSVTNCIFTGNSARYGGGMYNYDSSPVVTNCILWGDSSEIYNDDSWPSVTYSCVQGGYPGTGNIDSDPQFVDGGENSLQLLSGSPCVGAGTATDAPATDILGRPRPTGTGVVTMGAYEGSIDPASLVHLTIEISPTDWGAETWPAAGSSYAFAPGDYVVIMAKPGLFTRFSNWTGSATGTQPFTTILMDTDKTVTANFIVKPYILTYSAVEHGSISGSSRQAVDPGDSGSSVAAVPDPHYHFVQWSDGRTDNTRTDTEVISPITVTASFAANAVLYVMQGGMGDGSSWESPLGSIQAGIDAAASDKEIWVMAGTYTSTTNPVITMKEWVAIYGGFAGTESEWSQRDCGINVTIIDGENTRRCVLGVNYATLDGFTIMHGFVNGGNGGGGMYNMGDSLSVTNCTFTGNSADYYGGGMYNTGFSLVVNNCILWGDSSEIYNTSNSPFVTYSCVQGGYDGDGNINTDPLFMSAPDDLHLQDGSPCIDSGTSEGAPATDIEGVARPQGGGFDMGAYER